MSNSGSLTLAESNHIFRSTLTPDQYGDPLIIRFINEYMTSLDVPTAARAAGITANQGRNMLRIPEVNTVISKLNQKSTAKHGFKAEGLIRKLDELNDANLFDLLDEDGCVKPKHEIPRELQRAVKKFVVREEWMTDMNGMPMYDLAGRRVRKGRVVTCELNDQIKTIELLARDENILKQTSVVEHEVGKNAGAILHGDAVERAQARMREVGPAGAVQPAGEIGYTGPAREVDTDE